MATGSATAFGKIAVGLGERQAETAFQVGLRDFSALLVRVAAVLTISIFVINVALSRPLLEALLFSLAIAIGITPQLLPAIVSVSLSTGSRQLARRKVLVKRLVTIEDLGNIEVLFTDKTGTLTEGAVTFDASLDPTGQPTSPPAARLLCNEATMTSTGPVGGNALDAASVAGAGRSDADRHAPTIRPGSSGSARCRSTTIASSSRSSSGDAAAPRSSSPREPPRWYWPVAPTRRQAHVPPSTASSPTGRGSWRSRRARRTG